LSEAKRSNSPEAHRHIAGGLSFACVQVMKEVKLAVYQSLDLACTEVRARW